MQPFDIQPARPVAFDRADTDKLHLRGADFIEPGERRVIAGSAGIDLQILERQTTKTDKQLARFGEARPFGHRTGHGAAVADDMRDHRAAGMRRIGAFMDHRAADLVHETLEQRFAVMNAPGAGPAIGAGIDRFIAVIVAHPANFARHQIERRVPVERHKLFRAAARCVAVTALFQIALADIGPVDAQLGMHRFGDRLQQRRRVGVLGKRPDIGNPAILDIDFESPPMRGVLYPGPVAHCPRSLFSVRTIITQIARRRPHPSASSRPPLSIRHRRRGSEAVRHNPARHADPSDRARPPRSS